MITPERIVPTKTGFYVLLSNDELVPVTDLFNANGERVEHLGDAITALIERGSPEAEWSTSSRLKGDTRGGLERYSYGWVVLPGPDGTRASNAVATPALALCAAFCQAMAEKGERR